MPSARTRVSTHLRPYVTSTSPAILDISVSVHTRHLRLRLYKTSSPLAVQDISVSGWDLSMQLYGSIYYWSICQRQVDDLVAFLVLSCAMVGGTAVISDLQSVLVTHVLQESSIPLHLPSCVPSLAVGVEVSCEECAALPNDSLLVQLSLRSLSLSQRRLVLIVNIDNPRDNFISSPDVSSDNIVIGPCPQIRPHVNHQATPLPYRPPNSFSCSYLGCRMADVNVSSFSRRLFQAHYVRPAFDSRPQRRNGPLV